MIYKEFNCISDYIIYKCGEWEQRIFLKEKKTLLVYTYFEFLEEVKLASTFLNSLGIKSGDQIVLEMENSLAALAMFMGAMMINIVPIIISPKSKSNELKHTLKDCKAAAFFSPYEKRNNYGSIPFYTYNFSLYRNNLPKIFLSSKHIAYDNTAYITFTTGSTGTPRKINVSHCNMLLEIQSMAEAYGFTQNDRHLCILPLYHASGLYRNIFLPFHTGGYVLLSDAFHCDDFWQDIDSEKITFVQVVPSILKKLLMCKGNFKEGQAKTLKFVGSASAPHPIGLLQSFECRFGVYVLQGYGMTEATCGITLNLLSREKRKIGSVGKPLSINKIEVLDENDNALPQGDIGRIVITGNNITTFSDINDKIKNSGVHLGGKKIDTGDIGYIDADGFVWIVGRRQDIIKRGEYRISPNEIEDVITELFPEVEVAILGVSHKLLGQDVVAFISNNKNSLSSRDIIRKIKGKIASYKIPSEIIFVDSLPKLGVGKIDKKQLLNLYQDLLIK
jgi:acyl-CoA synthetase (AMP-forming)/AMP-acid ligase II